jgi:branched-chain amino acid transport system substrate-binding protein
MKKLFVGIVALASIAGWSGPADSQSVKVGLPVPLTGFVAESAKEMVEGFQLYLKQSGNKLGGLEVELVVEDTEAKPEMALTKMRKLVESDNVDLVVGYLLAFEGYAVRDYAHEKKVPTFMPIVAADDITQRQRSPYIVRMIWTSSQLNHPWGEYAYNELGYRRIATIGQDYAFGWETVAGFQTTFEDAGGEVVQKLWIPLDANDHGPYVSQINRDIDAVFALVVGAHIPKFVKTYQDFGLKDSIPLIGANILTDEDVLTHMGEEALDVLTSHSYAATLPRPENQAFVEAYRAEYGGKNPSYYAEAMYTAGLWLDRALAQTGEVDDPLALIEAVKSVDLTDAPRGPLKLDDYNNPIETVYIRKVVRAEDGGLENQVIDEVPNVSQFWKDDPEEYMSRPVYSRDNPGCPNCE